MLMLITRGELAKLAGVTPTAITKACRKQLAPACIGGRIDLEHEAVREYLAKDRSREPGKRLVLPAELLNVTIGDAVQRAGTLPGVAPAIDGSLELGAVFAALMRLASGDDGAGKVAAFRSSTPPEVSNA